MVARSLLPARVKVPGAICEVYPDSRERLLLRIRADLFDGRLLDVRRKRKIVSRVHVEVCPPVGVLIHKVRELRMIAEMLLAIDHVIVVRHAIISCAEGID